ncbi:hypothetical protein D3C72_1176470 [compost metagenome]
MARQRVLQQRNFCQFFRGERLPGPDFTVEFRFRFQAERHVQQGARRRQPQLAIALGRQRLQHDQGRVKVGAPDVAPVDDADRQDFMRGQPVRDTDQFMRRADAVHVQAGHGQAACQAEVFFQRREIRGQQDIDTYLVQLPVGALEGAAPRGGQVQAQDRFVDLHPRHALLFQTVEQGAVDGQQLFQQGQAVEAVCLFLAQPQEGEGADQGRLDLVAQRLRLGHFRQQALASERKPGLRRQFGHQVMVIGVKPLGHFQRGSACCVCRVRVVAVRVLRMRAGLCTARHREIARQRRLLWRKAETGRFAAQQLDMVGHLVVKGEVAHGNVVEPCIALQRPVARAQLPARRFQRCFGQLAAPVAFQRQFQFARGADTGKAKNVGMNGHDVIEI